MGPPTAIVNQEEKKQNTTDSPTGMEAFLSVESLLPNGSSFCQIDRKLAGHPLWDPSPQRVAAPPDLSLTD